MYNVYPFPVVKNFQKPLKMRHCRKYSKDLSLCPYETVFCSPECTYYDPQIVREERSNGVYLTAKSYQVLQEWKAGE
jgi:hypothetical protein